DSTEDGTPFLVMELIDGSTLATRAAESGGTLPVQQVLLAADQLLDVLAAAHAEGIVHRDIKPENVMITRQGAIKVLDFGIARLLAGDGPSVSATQTGYAMGTPGFMAPEQARGRWNQVDARSDIFSVGSTLFSLLSGEMIHREETVPELLAALFLKPARLLAEVLPDAPPALCRVVDKALRLDKAERWSSAREMRDALREAYRELYGADPAHAQRTRVSHISDLERSAVQRRPLAHERARVTPTAADAHEPRATIQAVATESVPAPATRPRRPWLIGAAVAALGVGFAWLLSHAAVRPSVPPRSALGEVPAPATAPWPAPAPSPADLAAQPISSAPSPPSSTAQAPARTASTGPAAATLPKAKKQPKPAPSANMFDRRY
ncbi:MAG TPA: serine/threonine-protein kinase, partial [Polyangiaceae bacterium]|nr:serine/threonine-protein kinase [Polyangiaceae bacterium]